jgi:DNA-binding response OmpR family regulator
MADTPDISPIPKDPQVLRCGDLVLDESRWTVHRGGTLVDLSPTEFRLLACLLRHQGSALSRTQLLQQVWGPGFSGRSQVVETYVSYLRRKLHRCGPPLIHTRRGAGYLICAPDPGAPDLGAPGQGGPGQDAPGPGTPAPGRGAAPPVASRPGTV